MATADSQGCLLRACWKPLRCGGGLRRLLQGGSLVQKDSKHCLDCSLKNSTTSQSAGARLGRIVAHTPQATRQHLRREWFFEQGDGNCRLMGSFATQLSELAPIWHRSVAPVAEWVAHAFWSTIQKPGAPFATRLTQNNKREAKGAPHMAPANKVPSQQNICAGCGNPIQQRSTHCPDCSQKNSTASLIVGAKLGREISQRPQAQARRKETKRLNDLARSQWWPSNLPAWLTEETYRRKIQPLLAKASLSEIASAISVSIPYASDIRKGRRSPHPRHWQGLAKLVGFSGQP